MPVRTEIAAIAFAISAVVAVFVVHSAQGDSTHDETSERESDGALSDAGRVFSPALDGCMAGYTVVEGDHCCHPGQHWSRDRCVGSPSSCPPGSALGHLHGVEACVPRECESGRVRASDGINCCWPGQHWTDGACSAESLTCPNGTHSIGRSDCAPPAGILRPHAPGNEPSGTIWIGGGTFRMGTRLRYVTVGPYWIDRTEATGAQYHRCIDAHGCEAVSDPFGMMSHASDHPVVNVSFVSAQRYCAWLGGRLPTEAEWEFAARGPDARRYPWGERAPDCTMARMQGCASGTESVTAFRASASPFGVLNMAGNVAEWTSDRVSSATASASVRDPMGPSSGEMRVVRGGGFSDDANGVMVTSRAARDAREARFDLGMRCVYTPR